MTPGLVVKSKVRQLPILLVAICLFLLCCFPCRAQETLVVITPHPDDAEASCGGLIANYREAGKKVIIVTMTGGELGIGGVAKDSARAIRKREAVNAANKLGAGIVFFGAEDASLAVDTATANALFHLLAGIHPAIVTAPWPLDVHPDHQATGLLAWRLFQDKRLSFALFFYETTNSPHTKSLSFVPTDYVDITDKITLKKKALSFHVSQHPEEWFDMYEKMAAFRGYEADTKFAEAYIRAQNSSGLGGRANKPGKLLNAY